MAVYTTLQVLDAVKAGTELNATVSPLMVGADTQATDCLLYTSPSPRDRQRSRMPSSA